MKVTVLIIMLIALYLLYRIAFPKQAGTKQGDDNPRKSEEDVSDVVVKSRFVRPAQGQPQPTPATVEKSEYQVEKASIFAAGNEKPDAVIPPEKLNEVFEDFNPDELVIPPDDRDGQPDETEETDEVETDLEEEAEDLRQTLGREAEQADGMTIEEMTETFTAIENPTDEKAGLLFRIEKTDMFEQLVSGDEGKAERIKAVIDRFVQIAFPDTENEFSDTDYNDFDISNFFK